MRQEVNQLFFFKFDSGSPLVCNGKLIGINSWGSENIKIPSIYTFIPYFESWIQETYRTLIVSQSFVLLKIFSS